MKSNAKKIIKELEREQSQRGRITLYLDKALFKRFKKACESEEVSASRVIEKLMEEFLGSIKGRQL